MIATILPRTCAAFHSGTSPNGGHAITSFPGKDTFNDKYV